MVKIKHPMSLRIMTINVPEYFITKIDALVREGLFPSRSEAIRVAIYQFLERTSGFLAYLEEKEPHPIISSDPNIIQLPDGTTKTIIKK